MFKYVLVTLIAYWLIKRVFRVADAIKRDSPKQPNYTKEADHTTSKSSVDHSKGGEYIDFEEVE